MIRGHKGLSIIEAIFAGLTLTSVLGLGLPLLYTGFIKIWARHVLHEGLICLAEDQPRHRCEQLATQKVRALLFWGQISKMELRRPMLQPPRGKLGLMLTDELNIHLREELTPL